MYIYGQPPPFARGYLILFYGLVCWTLKAILKNIFIGMWELPGEVFGLRRRERIAYVCLHE